MMLSLYDYSSRENLRPIRGRERLTSIVLAFRTKKPWPSYNEPAPGRPEVKTSPGFPATWP
jgi:hypothetical protein